ncbi:putative uncharacterized SMG1-like protein [Oncorhynchus tshawytscha]|uniref:putative uncharacterized SMG1-like protein n=1 Tax=Oncorhynchus tshawytscha TaxID=74940 RepID=UPI001C3CA2BA|nr:putative uncharacterized SMG1-like protein [Oncorhynchus tshawytscha]
MSRKALGFRLSSAHKLQRNWNDWQPRGDSVSAASQDGVKCIATRDLGPAAAAVYDPTAVGVATSDRPVSPPLLQNDAFPDTADTLDEGHVGVGATACLQHVGVGATACLQHVGV